MNSFITDAEPGIERGGSKRFRYVDQATGDLVSDESELARIRSIAVPPAWRDVWISADPAGHIQATGTSYVHPKVLTLFEQGRLVRVWYAGPKRPRAGLEAMSANCWAC